MKCTDTTNLAISVWKMILLLHFSITMGQKKEFFSFQKGFSWVRKVLLLVPSFQKILFLSEDPEVNKWNYSVAHFFCLLSPFSCLLLIVLSMRQWHAPQGDKLSSPWTCVFCFFTKALGKNPETYCSEPQDATPTMNFKLPSGFLVGFTFISRIYHLEIHFIITTMSYLYDT